MNHAWFSSHKLITDPFDLVNVIAKTRELNILWDYSQKIQFTYIIKIYQSKNKPDTNSSDAFSNLVHQFFLCLRSWKRKQISYSSKKGFLSQFASWKINHNKYPLTNFVDSEFETRENISWIRYWFHTLLISGSEWPFDQV